VDPNDSSCSFQTRSKILRNFTVVGSTFRTCAQTILFRHVVFTSVDSASRLIGTLEASTTLGRHVKSIRIAAAPILSEEEDEPVMLQKMKLDFLPALLGLCEPTMLRISGLGEVQDLELYSLLQSSPSLTDISISDSWLRVDSSRRKETDFSASRLRRIYLSEVSLFKVIMADEDPANYENLFTPLSTIPTFVSFALTYPSLYSHLNLEDSAQHNLSPLVALLPQLLCLSSTTQTLDATPSTLTTQPLLFLDCFASILDPISIRRLPSTLQVLRLNVTQQQDSGIPAELVNALKCWRAEALTELWVPFEWEQEEEMVEIEKWCKERGVWLVKEVWEGDEEDRVFDDPFWGISDGILRKVEDERRSGV
ncbi:hypothetical protein P7C70_g8447, partial [Phenoliferia sp. Uapishka_3]